nr:unnamed protein product [Digitaria exilis]
MYQSLAPQERRSMHPHERPGRREQQAPAVGTSSGVRRHGLVKNGRSPRVADGDSVGRKPQGLPLLPDP